MPHGDFFWGSVYGAGLALTIFIAFAICVGLFGVMR